MRHRLAIAGLPLLLDQALDIVEQGQLRVVLLLGDPGMGKTRLAAEIAARRHDIVRLSARAYPLGTTAALGLAALSRRLTDETSLVTALPVFDPLDLDEAGQFVVGGHDIRRGSFAQSVRDFQQRANVFDRDLSDACQPTVKLSPTQRLPSLSNMGLPPAR